MTRLVGQGGYLLDESKAWGLTIQPSNGGI